MRQDEILENEYRRAYLRELLDGGFISGDAAQNIAGRFLNGRERLSPAELDVWEWYIEPWFHIKCQTEWCENTVEPWPLGEDICGECINRESKDD